MFKPIVISLCLMLTINALAQHDPGRNSVRYIATDRIKEAEALVAKPPKKSNSPITVAQQHFVRSMAGSKEGDITKALLHAERAIEEGLPIERYQAESHYLFKKLFKNADFQGILKKHEKQLLHGPMLGCVTGTSASFWVRTATESDIEIKVYSSSAKAVSGKSKSVAADDYTARVEVKGLSANKTYKYDVYVNGKKTGNTANFKTHPEAGSASNFRIAFGGGAGFTIKYEHMWSTIKKREINALLLLGDNVYIDDPEHMLTNRYCYYRRQSQKEWKDLVRSTSVYTIYDDHDFGMNDCVPGPDIEKPAWKRPVWQTFRNNWNNPAYGGGTKQPGCWYDFYIGDVHFIMLDCRYYRDLKGGTMLGPVQKKWLFKTLKESKGKMKVLSSSVPWSPGVKPRSKDTWDGFPDERESIFTFIESNRIEGVMLMAADRHRSDMRRIKRPNGYDLYEVMSSKLTNVHTHPLMENAKGSEFIMGYNKNCSFGLLDFNTTASDPQLKYTIVDIDNNDIDSRTIKLSQLKFKK